MKRIFVSMLALPLVTSIFFIMCTKVNEAPIAQPEAPAAVSATATPTETAATEADSANFQRIEIHTESINGATHWMPEVVKVKAGQKYKLVAKHELTSGFEFHGLQIKEFDVLAQVNRNKEYTQVIDIPADKKGSFKIGCQFHPAHKSAQLIVE